MEKYKITFTTDVEIINYLESKLNILKDYMKDSKDDPERKERILENFMYSLNIGVKNYYLKIKEKYGKR
jgi:hypothetical protein